VTATPAPAPAPTRTRTRRLHLGIPATIGLVVLAIVLLVAFVGPYVAPYSATELAGIPYTTPNGDFWLGTDSLGRDVLSRVLYGGRSVILLAVGATALAYLIGGAIGLFAGYSRSIADGILMRGVDLLLAFPPLLLLLLVAAGIGAGPTVIVIGVAAINIPGIARIVRTVSLEVSVRGYVEAAITRGERTSAILVREVLPNIAGPLVADAGVRLTGSILFVAGLNFLGLGLQPPSSDWATMIAENRTSIDLQPWSVAAPAAMIAILTVAVNVVGDGISQRLGKSVGASG
jgi:ABC-type dipeptide/oligopeptide/nickel transport system permease subunit